MGEKQIEMEAGWGTEEGRAEEMESKKGRMLDPGVITGRQTERGKEEKVQLGEKNEGGNQRGKKTIIAMQDCNEFVMVFLVPHIKLIGVYFSPRVKCVPMCHIFTRQLQNLTALVTLPLIQA